MSSNPRGPKPEAFDLRHHDDDGLLVERLARWLAGRLGPATDPSISTTEDSIANGMSSSTLLFDLDWTEDNVEHHAELVARIAPSKDEITVFPSYDLGGQYATIATVAAKSNVPVPRLRWCEPTGEVLGQPFFVMDRVSGLVPPDMLPYTFGDNWLHDAADDERTRLQQHMIDVLVGLHAIDRVADTFPTLEGAGAPEGHLRRHLQRTRAWYDWSLGAGGVRSSLVEAALDHLDETFPADPGPTVLSWGDARIGNVVFDDFNPVAILDWEMADLGPRELDVAWLCYSHRVFQDLAEGLELPGLPDLLSIDGVFDAYATVTGHEPRAVGWHLLYAAVRWACAFLRTGAREAHLLSKPLPDDGDTLLHNRPSLDALLAGTFVH